MSLPWQSRDLVVGLTASGTGASAMTATTMMTGTGAEPAASRAGTGTTAAAPKAGGGSAAAAPKARTRTRRPGPAAGTTVSWQDLARALRPRFRVTADPATAVRRVWLDTFDWRLYRAGVTLEYLSRRGQHELVLAAPDGERLALAVPRLTWPGAAQQVPAGPLRERLVSLAGIRALLPVVSSAGTVRHLRVLDGQDKTVAHVTIDDAAVREHAGQGAAGPVLPPRVTVTPVRGYAPQAGRIGRLLAGVPGVCAAAGPALDAALAAAGREAVSYTSGVGVRLAPQMRAGCGLAAVLLRLLDVAEANVDGVVRDIDTEFLHDLRIAVRRTRTALKLAGDALPGGFAARFAPEFRWLGQLTTPVRDLDVHLLGFEVAAAGLVTAAPADLAPLHDSLVRYRAAEQRRLVRGLRSDRFACLTRDWRTALRDVAATSGAGVRRWPGSARVPVAELGAARIRRAHRRLVRTGSAVTPTSPEEHLHTVRKRGKELRYMLEFFATLHEPGLHRRAVRELKQLQDCLGDIQDGHVQREAVRALAARMLGERAAPAATLLAMGELAAQLDAAASRARDDFARRFAEFTSAGTTRRIAQLTSVTE